MAFLSRDKLNFWNQYRLTIIGCFLCCVGILMFIIGYAPFGSDSTGSNYPQNGQLSAATGTTQSATPRPALPDPKGQPTSMIIVQEGLEDITMDFAPRVKDSNGAFDSVPGKVAWWDELSWPTPGSVSTQKSLITGHMRNGSTHYSIERLIQLKAGATLKVTFDSGDVIEAKAIGDAVFVKKNLTNSKDEYLYNAPPAQIIRVTTCDPTNGLDSAGHTLENSMIFFERTK